MSEWLRPTSASFFSGVGGMDYGLERAGWATLSFSEIDKFANAVLGSRFPGLPNNGSITDWREWSDGPWQDAYLWAGGPPCQDFSVAGKRAGLEGARSGLALTWFDAVDRYRPRAILLENVPGILSSNNGLDLRALTLRLEELGYGWAYRTLNARWFGVPQRRRRVFLLAVHARTGLGADDAAAVLAVGHGCERHPGAGRAKGEEPSSRFADGVGADGPLEQAISSKWAKGSSGPAGDEHHNLLIVQPDVVGAIAPGAKGWRGIPGDGTDPLVFVKSRRAASAEDDETWIDGAESPTLNSFDTSDPRATTVVVQPVAATLNSNKAGGWRYDPDQSDNLVGTSVGVRRLTPLECERLQGWPDGWTIPDEWRKKRYDGSDLLPDGLDSARYRCIGNGVAAPVATWVGRRLLAALSANEQTEGVA